MKKFLSKIMVFLILLTIIYIITAQTFRYLDLQVKGESGRMRYIHNELIADSIIMGSSRALHHYDPDILGNYYNVGEDRMGIIFSMGRLQLLKQRRMPHMLIYDVEPDYDLLQDDNSTYLTNLRPYYHRPGIREIFWDVDSTERIKMLFPFYQYNSRLLKLLADWRHPAMSYTKGYSPYEGCQAIEKETLPQNKHDRKKYEYLHKLIAECKRSHTSLIFTASPQLSCQSDSVFRRFKLICQQEGIPFLNHYCDTAYTHHRVLFHNANHLNREGASLYSKEIKKEMSHRKFNASIKLPKKDKQ